MEFKLIFVAFSIVLFSIVPFIPQSFSEIIETDIPMEVFCDSPFPQLCEPPFTTNVETTSVLQVQYFASEMHCSSLRVHIFLDDTPVHTSDFFTWPGAPPPFDTLPSDTGVIDLGPVSEGIHKIDIQAEGQVSGCNTSGIGLWQGTARIFSDPPLPEPEPPEDGFELILEFLTGIQASINQILDLLLDQNFGLEEIKNEVRSIEGNITSEEFGLKEIKDEVRVIGQSLTDPNFGLEEIKNEVRALEEKLAQNVTVDLQVSQLSEFIYTILSTEFGEPVDVEVVLVKAIKKQGNNIQTDILESDEFSITNIQTGLISLQIEDKAKSKVDVLEVKVEHEHTNGVIHKGATIFEKKLVDDTSGKK